ncbi:MAG: reverse transcriptase/maturase family protein [Planctomycetes bacterium]|nr:reverse transcriptase/maturase family protein [Planctomycetota bacterium]
MKRIGGLMPRVFSFPNLLLAFRRASKGKKDRPAVARFAMDLEPELLRLQRQLENGVWKPGRYAHFTIRDPKERVISVAPFPDRVVHHAVINVTAPFLEARFDFDSYGCREGKGMDRALARARRHARRFDWCLKMDIRHFFASVCHDRLKGLLRETFKDEALLAVLDKIIDSVEAGLPLGNLTSQWLANFYLTPFDRFLRQRPEVRGMIRYMDDLLVFGSGRAALCSLLPLIKNYLEEELKLRLKEKMTHIHPTWAGIPFLGFRVFADRLLLRRETWKRFRTRLKQREWECRTDRLTDEELAESVTSMIAHLERASSEGLRRRFFESRISMQC